MGVKVMLTRRSPINILLLLLFDLPATSVNGPAIAQGYRLFPPDQS